jgi:hypothetical protein
MDFTGSLLDDVSQQLEKKYPDKLHSLTYDKPWSLKYIENNINWLSWISISANPNLTMEFIIKNKDFIRWDMLSRNSIITTLIIQTYVFLPWDFTQFSKNINLTLGFVISHISYKWDWQSIAKNSNIIGDELVPYLNTPETRRYIMSNPNLSMAFIENHINEIDFQIISLNTNLTIEFVKKYLFKLCPLRLAENPCIPIAFVEKHLIRQWAWGFVSLNPNITMEFVEKYKDNINWYSLASNKFNTNKIVIHRAHNHIQLRVYAYNLLVNIGVDKNIAYICVMYI